MFCVHGTVHLDVESGQPSRSFNAVLRYAFAGLGYFTEVSVIKILPGLDCGLTFPTSHLSMLNHFADSITGKIKTRFFFSGDSFIKTSDTYDGIYYNNKNVNSVQLFVTFTTDRRVTVY